MNISIGDLVECIDFSGRGSGKKLRENLPSSGLFLVKDIEIIEVDGLKDQEFLEVVNTETGWVHRTYTHRFKYVRSSPRPMEEFDMTLDEIHAAQDLVNGT